VVASQAVERIGWPESRIVLAEAALMVACSPKSNSCCVGIDKALEDVRNQRSGQVPVNLRDAHYKGAKELGHGAGYKYSHDYPMSRAIQQYMPKEFLGRKYYFPRESGNEARIRQRLAQVLGDLEERDKSIEK